MKKIFKLILLLTIIILISLGLSGLWWTLNTQIDKTSEILGIFEITEGEPVTSILSRLESEGFIKSQYALRIHSIIENKSLNFKFGKFELLKNNDISKIIDILNKGTVSEGITLTIREGLRDDQIIDQLLVNFSNLSKEKFLYLITNPSSYINIASYPFISNLYGISGMLFPDTYNFDTNSSEEIILQKLFSNFVVKTEQFHSQSDFYEKLVLSSIVERESSISDDTNIIASVFKNRLTLNMLLQSDATVNFITKKNDPGVLIQDTMIDSPYNTYKYTGLPPSPICNPGLRSINASYSDVKSDWLYFFHHNNNTYYSKTFAEHSQKLRNLGLL
jgi:UPF0755 protein